MRRTGIIAALGLLAPALALLGASPAPVTPPTTTEQWMSTFQTTWDALKTYTGTVTAREYQTGKIQDRVYQIWFEKPTSCRLNITGGDGKGSAAVWTGGDRVNGHQGGWLTMIHLNVNIHAKIATSMRGRTIAQAPFGAELDHLKSVKWKSTAVTVDGDKSTFTGIPDDPSQDGGLVKEVVTLGPNGLPVELTEYEGQDASIARHDVYTNIQTNVDIPASTWTI